MRGLAVALAAQPAGSSETAAGDNGGRDAVAVAGGGSRLVLGNVQASDGRVAANDAGALLHVQDSDDHLHLRPPPCLPWNIPHNLQHCRWGLSKPILFLRGSASGYDPLASCCLAARVTNRAYYVL
jgi:hypothetical protein